MKQKILVIAILTTLIGAIFRFWDTSSNPPGLNTDEVAYGYSAYSVLKTGNDETGQRFPLVFQSLGDYKNPVPAYLMVLTVKLFGNTNFSIRFWNGLFGTLSIIALYFFASYIFANKKLGLISSILLALSPWHIYFSRFAYEPLIASLFVMLAIWTFLLGIDGKRSYLALSALLFALTMYTGFAQRMFVPFIVVALLSIYRKQLIKHKVYTLVFGLLLAGFLLPLFYVSIFKGAASRLTAVFLANDVSFVRNVIFGNASGVVDYLYLLLFWVNRYLSYFRFDFLFVNGLHMTLPGTIGVGLFYPYEIATLLFGIFAFFTSKGKHKLLFTLWFLLGLVPDSITNNDQHPGRLLHIIFPLTMLSALGLNRLFLWFRSQKPVVSKICFSIFSFVVLFGFGHAYLTFVAHFPKEKGESFEEGLQQAVDFVLRNGDEYQHVVFDIRHGVEGPYLVANPHLYLLFYTAYDPAKYQQIEKYHAQPGEDPFFAFDKYEFGYINWPQDKARENTLFIGSPWSIPERELSDDEILERIYLSNGQLAYIIVSPNEK